MEQTFKAYCESFSEPARTVLEIGSRDGHDAEALRSLAGIAPQNVHIVEPHPITFKRIIYSYPEAHVYPLAISNRVGIVPFNAIDPDVHDSGISSLRQHSVDVPQNWLKVRSITGEILCGLIGASEIDLCKIDVEGMSYEVLLSFGDQLRRIRTMHIEVETVQIWKGQAVEQFVLDHMTAHGFALAYARNAWFSDGSQKDLIFSRLN